MFECLFNLNGQFTALKLPDRNLNWREFAWRKKIIGGNMPGGILLGGNMPCGILLGGKMPIGILPGGKMN